MPVPNLNDSLNIQRPAIEILMEQINVENNTELLASDFVFSSPLPASIVYSDANTEVTLTPKVTSNYYGSRTIYYKRMDIGVILNNEQVEILTTTETLLSEIVPQINSKYGINLTSDDYIDSVLPVLNPANPDAPLTVVIAIKPTSYLFQGTTSLILGHRVMEADETGITRNYYFITDVGANSVFLNNLVVLDSTFNVSQAFSIFRNALDIMKFRADNIIVLSNTDIALTGEFIFTAAIGSTPLQTHDVKTVVISNIGNIKSVSTDTLYGGVNQYSHATNRKVSSIYLLDKNNLIGTHSHKVYRFGIDGLIDVSFNPMSLNYQPELIRLDDVGNLYTVSQQLNTTSVLSTSTAHKHIRIDRFTPAGVVDPTFNPVFITSTGTSDVTPVIDLKPIAQLGAWVLVKPIHGVSTANDSPLINMLPFVPGNTATDGSFNPLFRFNNDGSQYVGFKQLLLNNNPSSVFTDSPEVLVDTVSINGSNSKATYITNRVNPITGYTHKAPVTFTANGSPVQLVTNNLIDDIKWETIKYMTPLMNGNFILVGNAKVRLQSGGWSHTLSRAAIYNKDSQLLRVIMTSSSTSVTDIFHVRVNEMSST